MRALRFVIPLVVLGGTARNAFAEDAAAVQPAPAPTERHVATVAVEPSVGLGTPVGFLGASLVVSPIRVLALHAGAGFGRQGPQIEAGLRYRVALGKSTYFAPGLSWSTGSFATTADDVRYDGEHSHIFYWDRAHFANATLSVEAISGTVAARPFVGLGYAFGKEISANSSTCPESGCHAVFIDHVLVFAGLAVSFEIF